MSNSKIQDLTVGRPFPIIIKFAIPLILTSLFQQLYNFADAAIIGRCLGVDAFSAVGVTGSAVWLTVGIAMGIALGFCIPIAQAFGAKQERDVSRYFWNGLYLAILIGAAVSAASLLLSKTLLEAINTPPELFEYALIYINITFLGIPVTVLYNYFASALRAFGDSKRPFCFLLASSALNILLDPIFIRTFGMGVAGAAWATVLSQAVSALLCAFWLFKKINVIKARDLNGSLLSFSLKRAVKLLSAGLPMAFEYSISSVGSIALQSSVNMLGLSLGNAVIAGQTAGEKIRMIATLPMEGVGMAISTYAAQNSGAGKYRRVKDGLKSGALIQIFYCVFAYLALLFLKNPLSVLLLGSKDGAAAAIDASVAYISVISLCFCFHGLLMVFRNTLQGMGYGALAVVSGFCEVAGRVIGGSLAVYFSSYLLIGFTNPLCWFLAMLYCLTAVSIVLKKRKDSNI